MKSQLKRAMTNDLKKINANLLSLPRNKIRLLFKLRTNSWSTKFVHDITCICNEQITVNHILFECNILLNHYINNNIRPTDFKDSKDLLQSEKALKVIDIILNTDLSKVL